MKSLLLMVAFVLVACTTDKPGASGNGDTAAAGSASRGDIVWNLLDEISGAVTRADLAAKFGTTNVVDTVIYLAEGEMRPGSVVFPEDSSRRVEITWMDSGARARPATVHLNGTASIWKLPHGITLGATLSELERLNGRPFTLMGFGWDYGGTVTDWRGGSLSGLKSGPPSVFLRLSPQGDGDSPDHSAVLGENEFASDLAAMKRLNPIVDRIVISYEGLGAN